jgi:hypothetical protein
MLASKYGMTVAQAHDAQRQMEQVLAQAVERAWVETAATDADLP